MQTSRGVCIHNYKRKNDKAMYKTTIEYINGNTTELVDKEPLNFNGKVKWHILKSKDGNQTIVNMDNVTRIIIEKVKED